MAKTIKVTREEIMAAQLIVKRAARGIGHASPAVIANAKRKRERASEVTEDRAAV